MVEPAERMKAMRARRRVGGVREVRLLLPDARTRAVRARVARSVARLDCDDEAEALAWIESVGQFDEPEALSER